MVFCSGPNMEGNDRTLVGLSLPRKFRLRRRNFLLSASKMVSARSPLMPDWASAATAARLSRGARPRVFFQLGSSTSNKMLWALMACADYRPRQYGRPEHGAPRRFRKNG